MSHQWRPTPYGHRQRDLNWLNTIFHTHDLHCGCDHPPRHLLLLMCENAGYLKLQKEDINNAQKCLGYGDPEDGDTLGGVAAITHEEDYIEDGELAALFDEEKDTTPR